MSGNVFIAEGFNGGEFTCGAQRTGKTYKAIKDLERKPKGVFFFNPQRSPTKFVKASGYMSFSDIRKALNEGEKIDYHPSSDGQRAKKEVELIGSYLFQHCGEFCWAVDEISFYLPNGAQNSPLLEIVRRGEGWANIEGYYIAQFPAGVHKDLIRGTYTHNIFYTDKSEKDYFNTKGIPYDSVMQILNQGGQYSYAKIVGGELQSNYFKENK